ncbi:MAG TPA: hypothetical protein VKV16_04610 [Solirubrobacteraceae bacterium]|nr:hypothetical protein [Solirubrobacteraceae bacterium]
MHSLQLRAALTDFVHEAAGALAAALAAGEEVRLELEPQRARAGARGVGSVLYAYRPLTAEFIAAHELELRRLPSHAPAARLLADFDGLERYLAGVSAEPERGRGRAAVDAAMLALLQDAFAEQTDFELRPERLDGALARLEGSVRAGAEATTVVATLHGLTITSPEIALTRGLTIAQPACIDGLPDGAVAGAAADEHLVVVLDAGAGDPLEAIARARAVLKDLLRALRLFGDGRVTLGTLAWARVGDGRWGALALGTGGRPYGMLVVTAEQEDELRAFCNLVSRRAPHDNELAWALRRFELGCERVSPFEALSDHLLALRVLLEPEGPASGLLPGRLAALCATPENRMQLTERVRAALALERDLVAGTAACGAAEQALATDLADHLRALLRDVICGHLDANLVGLADELLLSAAPVQAPPESVAQHASAQVSVEQMLSHAGESQEILDVFI